MPDQQPTSQKDTDRRESPFGLFDFIYRKYPASNKRALEIFGFLIPSPGPQTDDYKMLQSAVAELEVNDSLREYLDNSPLLLGWQL